MIPAAPGPAPRDVHRVGAEGGRRGPVAGGVHPVAQLEGPGEHRRIGVVAVLAPAEVVLVPVAVEVVARLGPGGGRRQQRGGDREDDQTTSGHQGEQQQQPDGRPPRGLGAPDGGRAVRELAVAVPILRVAHVLRAGMDRRVHVVAVALAGRDSIPVAVPLVRSPEPHHQRQVAEPRVLPERRVRHVYAPRRPHVAVRLRELALPQEQSLLARQPHREDVALPGAEGDADPLRAEPAALELRRGIALEEQLHRAEVVLGPHLEDDVGIERVDLHREAVQHRAIGHVDAHPVPARGDVRAHVAGELVAHAARAAVAVDAVAELRSARAARGVEVVAVAVAHRRAVPVLVLLAHDLPVAVVVDPVAELRTARGPPRIRVVAVAHAHREAVPVGVLVARRRGVAVAVHPVAVLGQIGRHARILVVAVALAGPRPVAVRVGLEDRGHPHHAVAVVVEAVADLHQPRPHRRVVVVAVAEAHPRAVAVRVHLVGHQGPVAVVVHAVAQLGRVGVHGRVAVVALGARAPAVQVLVAARVHDAVAVVVHAVADLDGALVGAGIGVVAVDARGHAVAVVVHRLEPRPQEAVAVVVDPVADLGGVGVDRGVGVVAVAAAEAPAVAVYVVGRVVLGWEQDPVAVVVDPVADLHGAREDGRVVVVAVVAAGEPVQVLVDLRREEEPLAEEVPPQEDGPRHRRAPGRVVDRAQEGAHARRGPGGVAAERVGDAHGHGRLDPEQVLVAGHHRDVERGGREPAEGRAVGPRGGGRDAREVPGGPGALVDHPVQDGPRAGVHVHGEEGHDVVGRDHQVVREQAVAAVAHAGAPGRDLRGGAEPAVAVVVHAVADLGGARMHRGIGVVAVGAVRVEVHVLVDAVAGLGRSGGPDRCDHAGRDARS